VVEADSGAEPFYIAYHDGNVHYGVYPSSDNAALKDVC
jgi:hypothetical protein